MALNDGDGNKPAVGESDDEALASEADSEMQRLAGLNVPSSPKIPAPPEIEFQRPALSRKALDRAFPGPDKNLFGTAQAGSSGDLNGNAGRPSHLGAGLIIGITFPACIIVGASIGIWIDHHYNHSPTPWGTIVFTLVGIAAGLINVYRALDMIGVAKIKGGKK